MEVVGRDYIFMFVIGLFIIGYGEFGDCNGLYCFDFCFYFGYVVIDIREIGLIVDFDVRLSFILICLYFIELLLVIILNFI